MKSPMTSPANRWVWIVPLLAPAAIAMADPAVVNNPYAPAPTVAPNSQPQANPLADPHLLSNRILILPFEAVNGNDPNFWLGKSIQQSLQADLTSSAPGRVVVDDHPVPNVESAVRIAKDHDARYVIAGGFVTVDREVRITGQLIDAATGQAISSLKATGDTSQIFSLEDTLARQARSELFPNTSPPPATAAPLNEPAAPQTSDTTGVRTDYADAYASQTNPYYSTYANPPTQSVYGGPVSTTYVYSNYPYYDTYYPSPYYYYPAYPVLPFYDFGFCYPVGFGFTFGFFDFHHRHFDHDRDFGHFHGHHDGFESTHHGDLNFRGGGRLSGSGRAFAGANTVAPGVLRSSSSGARFGASGFRSVTADRGSTFNRQSFVSRSNTGAFRGGVSTRSFNGGSAFHGNAVSHAGGFHTGGFSHSSGGFHGGGMSHASAGGHGGHGGHR